jgi:hypothetical protein
MIQFFSVLFVAAVLVTSPHAPPLPTAQAIALTKADLPASTSFVPRLTQFVSTRQLNTDTVPSGLSVKRLRLAGFRGMYSQTLIQAHDDQPWGYPWTYVALANARGAHAVYSEWVAGTKKPFNTLLGVSHAASECRLYRSVLSTHLIGLLCRTGSYVVFGHFSSRGSVEQLMGRVVQHAAELHS